SAALEEDASKGEDLLVVFKIDPTESNGGLMRLLIHNGVEEIFDG
ncbi:hypothetical protein NPIL_569171, partial [Nephila pilipes]